MSFLCWSASYALSFACSAGIGGVASGGSTCGIFSVAASVNVKMYLFNNNISLCYFLILIDTYFLIEAGKECSGATWMIAWISGCTCMNLHVLVIVGSLVEGHLASEDIAHKRSLSRVDPEMIFEVMRLLEKSSVCIVARETFGLIAFPDLELSLSFGVDEGEDTIA